MVVAGSNVVVEAATKLAADTFDFVKLRAQHSRGLIPNADVQRLRQAERDFASLVIAELKL
ncbi:hypothetical protein DFR71_6293 [Nocardia alba]|uniref:Uncharacterized protein n=2 Tax=Nocardia alba TaxID=225051 RepID=A0A4R1F8S2_9NOCA|nr:hypothetical protein DFR71_6293 [Nocardia alba]